MKKLTKKPKIRRARRVRARIHGTAKRPRLSVFRSNKHFYAQLIDDDARKTIAAISDKEIVGAKKSTHVVTETAKKLGVALAQKAKEKGIATVVFDRGSYRFHGRVKSFADGAREGGLQF